MPVAVSGMFSVDVTDEFSNNLRVSLRLEHKPFASQELLDVLVVGDDTVVNNFMIIIVKIQLRNTSLISDLRNHFSVHHCGDGSWCPKEPRAWPTLCELYPRGSQPSR